MASCQAVMPYAWSRRWARRRAGEPVCGGGAGGVAGDQVHGALLEESGGFAALVAFDAAVGRVGGAGGDAG